MVAMDGKASHLIERRGFPNSPPLTLLRLLCPFRSYSQCKSSILGGHPHFGAYVVIRSRNVYQSIEHHFFWIVLHRHYNAISAHAEAIQHARFAFGSTPQFLMKAWFQNYPCRLFNIYSSVHIPDSVLRYVGSDCRSLAFGSECLSNKG
jgi:hypothetical protein